MHRIFFECFLTSQKRQSKQRLSILVPVLILVSKLVTVVQSITGNPCSAIPACYVTIMLPSLSWLPCSILHACMDVRSSRTSCVFCVARQISFHDFVSSLDLCQSNESEITTLKFLYAPVSSHVLTT